MVGVRKSDTNRLVDEENVRGLVPRVGVERSAVRAGDPTRTEFHEQANGRRATRSAVGPEDHVVMVGVAPALEEVEEQVPCFNVYVSCVRTMQIVWFNGITPKQVRLRLLHGTVAEVRLLDPYVVVGKCAVAEMGIVCGGKHRQVSESLIRYRLCLGTEVRAGFRRCQRCLRRTSILDKSCRAEQETDPES